MVVCVSFLCGVSGFYRDDVVIDRLKCNCGNFKVCNIDRYFDDSDILCDIGGNVY